MGLSSSVRTTKAAESRVAERMVYEWKDELDTEEGWAKVDPHYWRRDDRGYVEFFFAHVPHRTAFDQADRRLRGLGDGHRLARRSWLAQLEPEIIGPAEVAASWANGSVARYSLSTAQRRQVDAWRGEVSPSRSTREAV